MRTAYGKHRETEPMHWHRALGDVPGEVNARPGSNFKQQIRQENSQAENIHNQATEHSGFLKTYS